MNLVITFRRLGDICGILFSLAIIGFGLSFVVTAVQRNIWQFSGRQALKTEVAHLDRQAAKSQLVSLSGRFACDGAVDLVEKSSYLGTPLADKAIARLYPFGDSSSPKRIYVRYSLPHAHAVPCDTETEVRGVWRDFSSGDISQIVSVQQGADLERYGLELAWMTLMLPHPDSSGNIEAVGAGKLADFGDLALYGLTGLAVIGIGAARLDARFSWPKKG